MSLLQNIHNIIYTDLDYCLLTTIIESVDSIRGLEPVFTNLGICYIFNTGKVRPPLQSVGAGERHGLLLEVDVDQKQYLTAEDAGVKIALHTQSEPPLPDDYGIAVPRGKKAFVRVKQLNTNDQTHSKKHCKSMTIYPLSIS